MSKLTKNNVREGGDQYFKEVAITPEGKMVSIYDGETEYVLGKEMRQRALQDHKGGFYVYKTVDEAMFAGFPVKSKADMLPRGCIRVRAEGSYCRYLNKLAFSRVTPLEIVDLPYGISHKAWSALKAQYSNLETA